MVLAMLIRTSLLWFLVALPLGCQAGHGEDLQSKWLSVAGGMRDRGSPSVILLLSWDPSNAVGTLNSCTAEIVAPDVLLTAAHCLQKKGQTYAAYLGHDGNDLGMPIDPTKANVRAQLKMAKEIHPHPQYVTTQGFHDVGVVVLQTAITGIDPLPILRTAPTQAMLQDLDIIGYGKTHDRDTSFAVTKYRADGLTGRLDATHTLTVGDDERHACVGDSGGPVLADVDGVATIIGVDSYSDETGDASRCRMPSHYQRVDTYVAFLDRFIPAATPDAGIGGSPREDGGARRDGGTSRDAGEEEDAGPTSDAAVAADAGGRDAGADGGRDAGMSGNKKDAGRSDGEFEDDEEAEEESELSDGEQSQAGGGEGCGLGSQQRIGALELAALLLSFTWLRGPRMSRAAVKRS
jgi:V8-like Glu-specific endopeptidase